MEKFMKTVRAATKATGLLIALLLLLLVIGNAIDPVEGEAFMHLSGKEWLIFLLFPMSPIIGYLLSLKKVFFGNMVVVAGMLLLLIMRTDLIMTGIVLLALPAVISLGMHTRK